MQITPVKGYNPNFQKLVPVDKLFEATTMKLYSSDDISGTKILIDTFWPVTLKNTGHKGYRYYVGIISEEIMKKYKDISKYSSEIIEKINTENIKGREKTREIMKPYIEKFPKEIDIDIEIPAHYIRKKA